MLLNPRMQRSARGRCSMSSYGPGPLSSSQNANPWFCGKERPADGGLLLPERRERRLPAVLGARDDRRAELAVQLEDLGATVDPEVVVAAHVARSTRRPVTTLRRRLAVAVGRLGPGRNELLLGLLDLLRLLSRQQELVAELRRALEGRERGHVVEAGEVRLSGGGPRDVVLCEEHPGAQCDHGGESPRSERPADCAHRCLLL